MFMITRLSQPRNVNSGQGQVVTQLGHAAHGGHVSRRDKHIGAVVTYLS